MLFPISLRAMDRDLLFLWRKLHVITVKESQEKVIFLRTIVFPAFKIHQDAIQDLFFRNDERGIFRRRSRIVTHEIALVEIVLLYGPVLPSQKTVQINERTDAFGYDDRRLLR